VGGALAKYGVLWILVVLLLGACGPNVTPEDLSEPR
jgi:hypothetical protein